MKKSDGYLRISSEDTHCYISCPCDDDYGHLSITDFQIVRCPKCNRGFRTEFVVWIYSPDEDDPEIPNEGER